MRRSGLFLVMLLGAMVVVAVAVPLISAPECAPHFVCIPDRHVSLTRYLFGFGGESSYNFTYYYFYW